MPTYKNEGLENIYIGDGINGESFISPQHTIETKGFHTNDDLTLVVDTPLQSPLSIAPTSYTSGIDLTHTMQDVTRIVVFQVASGEVNFYSETKDVLIIKLESKSSFLWKCETFLHDIVVEPVVESTINIYEFSEDDNDNIQLFLGAESISGGVADIVSIDSGDVLINAIRNAVEKIDDLQGALKSQDTDRLLAGVTDSAGTEINPAQEDGNLALLNTVLGTVDDAVVLTDAVGTLSAKVRGLVSIVDAISDTTLGVIKSQEQSSIPFRHTDPESILKSSNVALTTSLVTMLTSDISCKGFKTVWIELAYTINTSVGVNFKVIGHDSSGGVDCDVHHKIVSAPGTSLSTDNSSVTFDTDENKIVYIEITPNGLPYINIHMSVDTVNTAALVTTLKEHRIY